MPEPSRQPAEPAAPSPAAPAPKAPARRSPLFTSQPPMRRVVYALMPIAAAAVYFFGWRVLAVLGVCHVVGIATEWIMARQRKAHVSQACLVTAWLYGLSLPPTVPLWVAGVGMVVAILFAKEVFGGFGRNFANPAITGRAFVYICFPNDLTQRFVPAFSEWPGGLAHWSFESLQALPHDLAARLDGAGRTIADAISQASPMWVGREFGTGAVVNHGQGATLWNMAVGNIGGVFQAPGQATRILSAGSMGEGCAVLIVLAAAYLLITKTANWRLMLGGLLGLVAANLLFRNVLGNDGLGGVPALEWQLLAGTTLYVLAFMVTDPVSAPKRRPAQWAYAVLIGFLIVLLRWKGVFVAAATFAVLLGNLVGPLLDLGADAWSQWRKARQAAPAPATEPAEQGGKP